MPLKGGEALNNSAVVKKMRSFVISESFMAILFVVACIITTFRLEVIGTAVFCLLISFLLVVCDDLLTTTLPFLLLTQTVIKQYDSYDTFIGLIWIAIPVVASLVFHFVYYKHKLCKGKYFYAVLASSIAVTLGGVGFISAEEYFSLVSFYYVFGLGFGMLFIYVPSISRVIRCGALSPGIRTEPITISVSGNSFTML